MLLHPDDRTLSDFVDGELAPNRARRVAAHVERCARCRATAWAFRALDAAAQETGAPALPEDLLARTVARRAAGEEVILPVAAGDVPARSPRARWRSLAAGIFIAVVAGGALWLNSAALVADASELRMEPAAPRAGERITVEYQATSRLSDHPVLVLRARLREPGSGMGAETRTLARLERQRDRTYRGAFVLPDSVVYAVLAIEDPEALDVDANNELWEVLVHDADGRPLVTALSEQYGDLSMRNTLRAAEVAAELARLYPHVTESWFPQFIEQTAQAPQAVRDSIAAAHRARLPGLLAHADTSDVTDVTNVVFYAGGIGDTATAREWRDLLLRRFPGTRHAHQQQVFALADAGGGAEAFFAGAERLWQADSQQQGQLAFSAFQAAQIRKDAAQIRRWAPRLLAQGDFDRGMVIPAYLSLPELRAEGMDHIRAYVKDVERWRDDYRPLTFNASDFRVMTRRTAAYQLAQLGQALVDAGQQRAALDTLAIAAEATWSPPLFRTVADTRLAVGDTVGALPLLARVAADPLTATAFADSVARRFPRHFDAAHWRAWQAEGAKALATHLGYQATNRAARGSFRVVDVAGKKHTFEPAAEGETFVAVWSRHCPPSLMQLEALDRITGELAARGVRVITVTDEEPGEELVAFMAKRKLGFTWYHDADREVRRSLDASATPTYLVLDRAGRVRFENHSLDDVLRQVWLLQRARAGVGVD